MNFFPTRKASPWCFKHLGVSKERYSGGAQKSKFVWIKGLFPPVTSDTEACPAGVALKRIQKAYPYGNLASNLLGCVGQDKGGVSIIGLEGVELIFETYLRGVSGVIKTVESKSMTNVKTWDMDSVISANFDPSDHRRYHPEHRRRRSAIVKVYKPKSAFILVMNLQTGELLAIANRELRQQ
jgi:hypothetical protein